jgi:hypothetical protein
MFNWDFIFDAENAETYFVIFMLLSRFYAACFLIQPLAILSNIYLLSNPSFQVGLKRD